MWTVEIRTESNTSAYMSTGRIWLHKDCVPEHGKAIPAVIYSPLDVHCSLSKSGNIMNLNGGFDNVLQGLQSTHYMSFTVDIKRYITVFWERVQPQRDQTP